MPTGIIDRLRRRRSPGPAASRPGPPTADLRWEAIPASGLDRHPELVAELLDRRRDGVTITGVLTPEEAAATVTRAAASDADRTAWPGGELIGMSIGLSGADRSDYFADVARSTSAYRTIFGFDPAARVAQVLAPGSGPTPVAPLVEDGHRYNPGQLRWYHPGGGGLKAHAGNEFTDMGRDAGMSHLVRVLAVEDHLSYFVVLQRPEAGGSLSVFDLVWEQHSQHPVPWGQADRDDSWFDDLARLEVDAAPGDMVLFGGGWRWHRVEPVHGTRPRVTYGGFAAPARAGGALHLWA